jgi:hypothetical protein
MKIAQEIFIAEQPLFLLFFQRKYKILENQP